MTIDYLELAKLAAQTADAKKAEDIAILDLREVSDMCDFFVIATGSNSRQVDAVIDEIREKIREASGLSPLSTEGREELSWVLLDYGALVVHVFNPEMRDYYRLEQLWGEAPRVEINYEV